MTTLKLFAYGNKSRRITISRLSENLNVSDHGRHRAEVEDRRVGADSAALAPTPRSIRVTPRSEISLLSVTINYRIPKKYFMLVNLVSINRIEKLFQSLPRCFEKESAVKAYEQIGKGWTHLSDPLFSPDRNEINYRRRNVYRLCTNTYTFIHDPIYGSVERI